MVANDDDDNNRFRMIDCGQRTAEWYKLHEQNAKDFHISASAVASACGFGFDSSRKLARRYLQQCSPTKSNAAMAYGTEHEDEALATFNELMPQFKTLTVGSIFSPQYEWMSASLDALIVDEARGVLANLEIKCPYHSHYAREVPDFKYVIQTYVQMHCTNLDHSIIFYWMPDTALCTAFYIGEFDNNFWNLIVRRVKAFKRCVEDGQVYMERPDKSIRTYYETIVAPSIKKISF